MKSGSLIEWGLEIPRDYSIAMEEKISSGTFWKKDK